MNHAVNWEAISAIGQIVGALAVVISLIYVTREVRSNAHATRHAAMRSTLDAFNRLAEQTAEHPDLAEVWERGIEDYESLKGVDLARFNSRMHQLFRKWGMGIIGTWRGIWTHACGVGSKRSCVTSTHVLEFRPGGVHTRIGSVGRSLRSSLISNSRQPSPQGCIANQ
jgi:hypothetical protein